MEEKKAGRPRIELSDADFEKITAMVRIQCTQEEICQVMKMSIDTLDRRLKERGEENFAGFYKKNQDEGRASLRRAQWKAAQDGNPTMLVWLGKQHLGQRDKSDQKVTIVKPRGCPCRA
jgi:hypothetical protein